MLEHEKHFSWKIVHNVGWRFPDPFLKSQNSAYLWTNNLNFYVVCSYCICQNESYQSILKLSYWPLAFTLLSDFIEITLWDGCSVDLSHVFRTPFCKNTYGGLLLNSYKKAGLPMKRVSTKENKYYYCSCILTFLFFDQI